MFKSPWKCANHTKPLGDSFTGCGNSNYLVCKSGSCDQGPCQGPGGYFIRTITAGNIKYDYFAYLGVQMTNTGSNPLVVQFARSLEKNGAPIEVETMTHRLVGGETITFSPFKQTYEKGNWVTISIACTYPSPPSFVQVASLQPNQYLSIPGINVNIGCPDLSGCQNVKSVLLGPLPVNVQFDADNGVLRISPGNDSLGNYTFTSSSVGTPTPVSTLLQIPPQCQISDVFGSTPDIQKALFELQLALRQRDPLFKINQFS